MTPAALVFVAVVSAAFAGGAPPRANAWRISSKAYVRSLARAPTRLLERVDPTRGLVVASSLTCEHEPREKFTRACGAAIERAARTVLDALAGQLRVNARVGGPGVSCKATPRPTCTVAPTSECEPEIAIVFADSTDTAPVIAIVARDDWQSQHIYRARTNRRIEKLLAEQSDGCR